MTNKRRDADIQCVDLFCGAGGLTHGLENAGIPVSLGIDHDPACEIPYKSNNNARFALADVAEVAAEDLRRAWGGAPVRVLVGCAPCQPFSTYTWKSERDNDPRWLMLHHFGRLVQEAKPHLVAMENVTPLKLESVFDDFCHTLAAYNYRITWGILNCVDYSVPQERKRLILLASRLGKIKLPAPLSPFYRKTVRDAIESLPPLEAGEVCEMDLLHQTSSLSPVNLERIQASRPGGNWHEWPDELVSKCHRALSGNSYGNVYGRMVWDRPAPTITTRFYTFGCGRYGHPVQDRALSIREGALLQSFPREYRFVPKGQDVSKKSIARMIGNAVPPKLGEAIGRALREHVREWTASQEGEMEYAQYSHNNP